MDICGKFLIFLSQDVKLTEMKLTQYISTILMYLDSIILIFCSAYTNNIMAGSKLGPSLTCATMVLRLRPLQ